MYEKTDKVIAVLYRDAQKRFSEYQNVLPVDEINILKSAKILFKRLEKKSRKWYNILAKYYYDFFGGKPSFWRDDIVTDYLEEFSDPVTKYIYANEVERKAERMAEAIDADRKSAEKEIRKARRLWMLQTDRYAVAVSDLAQIEAYKSRGVKYVRWVTNLDGRECRECHDRNGVVYPINAMPAKPHYGCRCTLKEATAAEYDRKKTTGR